LPNEISRTWLPIIAFATVLIVDTFYNTLYVFLLLRGVNGRALLAVDCGLDAGVIQGFSFRYGNCWPFFFRYVFFITLIHHTALFFIEASSLALLIPTLIWIGASTLLPQW